MRNQPSFCPICGSEFSMLPPLLGHLHTEHRLLGRDAWVPYRVAWRELDCALLGITNPEWDGP
ncbi:MAG TPA: hypothetical protein VFF67_09920 [Thermoplasmata archaeon]|nr:hypothetical protein [Thermoplasmata archaeon]